MKKVFVIITSLFVLQACSNNGGESGTVNDGFKGAGDPNGGLADTANNTNGPAIDTARMDHRTDTEKRDTFDTDR